MSDVPQITLNGYANAVRVEIDNHRGRDWVLYRGDTQGGRGGYTEHAATGNPRFAELVDNLTTYKYAAAFIEDGNIGVRSKDSIRPRRTQQVDSPTFAGSEAVFPNPQPPVFTGLSAELL